LPTFNDLEQFLKVESVILVNVTFYCLACGLFTIATNMKDKVRL